MKRLWLLLATLAVLVLCADTRARAYDSTDFEVALSAVEGEPGDDTELTVTYLGLPTCAETLLCRVDFNMEVLTLKSTVEPTVDGYFSVTVPCGGWADTCCVSDGTDGTTIMPGTEFKYRFTVNETAPVDETVITVTLKLDDAAAQGTAVFTVLPKPSSSTELLSLLPDSGQLIPEFTTENLEYSLTVPSNVDKLSFSAEAAEGATCKVNRTNLGKIGSDTDFKLTVTAADGKTKAVYTVKVHRAEASPSPSAAQSPTPTQTAATAKPTAAPSPIESTVEKSPSPTAFAKPVSAPQSATVQPVQGALTSTEQPTSSPTPTTQTASPQYITTQTTQPIAVRGLGSDILPLAAALVVLIASIGVSKPLAHTIAVLIARKKQGRG